MSGLPRSTHDGTPGSYLSISMPCSCVSTTGRDATLRPVGSFEVVRDFTPADVARVRSLTDTIEAATGIAPLGDDAWTGMHAAAGRDRGLFDDTGHAYAHLAHHHARELSLELAVLADVAAERR